MEELKMVVWALSPFLGFVGVCMVAMIVKGEW